MLLIDAAALAPSAPPLAAYARALQRPQLPLCCYAASLAQMKRAQKHKTLHKAGLCPKIRSGPQVQGKAGARARGLPACVPRLAAQLRLWAGVTHHRDDLDLLVVWDFLIGQHAQTRDGVLNKARQGRA